MPYTVTGRFDDGAAYTVLVTGRKDRPVAGSHRAAALVELHQGEAVSLSPTGPVRTVDGADEATVRAVLRQATEVLEEKVKTPQTGRTAGA
ncbi:hypothetical protein [Streptomyces rubiginosohelvolus]|uniref:hypothetical protein n=1 Tax=Streptomyces rubiginosohelvolus TaxID=67362 RepID=UPI0035DEEA3D